MAFSVSPIPYIYAKIELFEFLVRSGGAFEGVRRFLVPLRPFVHQGKYGGGGVLTAPHRQAAGVNLRRVHGAVAEFSLKKLHAGPCVQGQTASDVTEVVRPDVPNAGRCVDVPLYER